MDARMDASDDSFLCINHSFNKNQIVSSALEEVGYKTMAHDARTQQNDEILNGYIKIIVRKAIQLNKPTALNSLFYNGLI
jgi:hypothetical protein